MFWERKALENAPLKVYMNFGMLMWVCPRLISSDSSITYYVLNDPKHPTSNDWEMWEEYRGKYKILWSLQSFDFHRRVALMAVQNQEIP